MLMKLTAALDSAGTLAQVDELARGFWIAHGAGQIADADAERVSAHIEAARERIKPAAERAPGRPLGRASIFSARKRRRVSLDRLKVRARRRALSGCGSMPPAIWSRFTEGQRAVLTVIANEVRAKGSCRLSLDQLAATAGVSDTWARRAIRLAEGDNLIKRDERRQRGRKNLTNIITIKSAEWLKWLAWKGRVNKSPPPSVIRTEKAKETAAYGENRRPRSERGREAEAIRQDAIQAEGGRDALSRRREGRGTASG